MTDPLARTWVDVQSAAWDVTPADTEALDRALSRIGADGLRAWPGVEIEPVALARYIAERAPDRTEPVEALADMETTDLYLALGCVQRMPRALEHFERSVMSGVAPAISRVDRDPGFARDVEEEVRIKMLSPADGSAPRIGTYLGRGPLKSWVQVAAIRTAYGLKRQRPRDAAGDVEKLAALPFDGADAELAHIRDQVSEPFGRAFRVALLGLTPRDRNVLRMYVLEGIAADTIGRMYAVHRATVARWIARARAELVAATKRELARELRLGPSELESLMRLVDSKLDVSIVSCLDV